MFLIVAISEGKTLVIALKKICQDISWLLCFLVNKNKTHRYPPAQIATLSWRKTVWTLEPKWHRILFNFSSKDLISECYLGKYSDPGALAPLPLLFSLLWLCLILFYTSYTILYLQYPLSSMQPLWLDSSRRFPPYWSTKLVVSATASPKSRLAPRESPVLFEHLLDSVARLKGWVQGKKSERYCKHTTTGANPPLNMAWWIVLVGIPIINHIAPYSFSRYAVWLTSDHK